MQDEYVQIAVLILVQLIFSNKVSRSIQKWQREGIALYMLFWKQNVLFLCYIYVYTYLNMC